MPSKIFDNQSKIDSVIYYDARQEAEWFKSLDSRLSGIEILPIPSNPENHSLLKQVLAYDRPDIILVINGVIVLVLERSEEVPSGHNVGQRFARLAAAAEAEVPCIYIFPFKAMKHGGDTAGPRYVNLRLFDTLKKVFDAKNTLLGIINWPVDARSELIRTPEKDVKTKAFVSAILDHVDSEHAPPKPSDFASISTQKELEKEIKNAKDLAPRRNTYSTPPKSLKIISSKSIAENFEIPIKNFNFDESVVYKIGMKYIRSDPYTGMAMMYHHLYACDSTGKKQRDVVLLMPEISIEEWRIKDRDSSRSKDIRLFKETGDIIIFKDGYLSEDGLFVKT